MQSSTLREADMDARWIALAVLTTARASMGYQFQSLAAVSPLLIDEFGLGYADVGFLIGLYFLPGMALAMPGGLLGQRFGDKRIVLVGLALMTFGGFCAALAESYGLLLVGRLLSGFGAVLLNVLMAKMITDWFANREIVLAMAIFINSFPIGIGLALLSLGWIAESAGWHVALHATAMVTSAALLLVMTLYRRHSNDQLVQRSGSPAERATSQEITQVCIAGAIWGMYNGVFAILLSFAPPASYRSRTGSGRCGFYRQPCDLADCYVGPSRRYDCSPVGASPYPDADRHRLLWHGTFTATYSTASPHAPSDWLDWWIACCDHTLAASRGSASGQPRVGYGTVLYLLLCWHDGIAAHCRLATGLFWKRCDAALSWLRYHALDTSAVRAVSLSAGPLGETLQVGTSRAS